jgi:translation initiation factor 3 subunit C
MQLTDSHTTEYIARLREEPILLALADKAVSYFQRIKDNRNFAFVSLRQAEHFYYKTESVYVAMRNLIEASKASGVEPADVKATPSETAAEKSSQPNGISCTFCRCCAIHSDSRRCR